MITSFNPDSSPEMAMETLSIDVGEDGRSDAYVEMVQDLAARPISRPLVWQLVGIEMRIVAEATAHRRELSEDALDALILIAEYKRQCREYIAARDAEAAIAAPLQRAVNPELPRMATLLRMSMAERDQLYETINFTRHSGKRERK
jgi:hypothetical protein